MNPQLRFSTKKALCVQLGDEAGQEVVELLQALAERVNQLERSKVDVTPIIRSAPGNVPPHRRRAA